MATKTGLIGIIDGFLTAIITQAKVRSSASAVVDEIYNTTYTENYYPATTTTTAITTTVSLQKRYRILFNKSGNRVNCSGLIQNFDTNILSNTTWLNITNTEFQAKTFTFDQIFIARANSGETVRISLTGGTFYVLDNVIQARQYYFNFNYITND
jgi:hypothetical protein